MESEGLASPDDVFEGEGEPDDDGDEGDPEDDGEPEVDGDDEPGDDGEVDSLGTVTVGESVPGRADVVVGSSDGAGWIPRAIRCEGAVPETCGQAQPMASQPAGRVRKLVVMKTLK